MALGAVMIRFSRICEMLAREKRPPPVAAHGAKAVR
jgi:hypothetical protein